MSNETGSGTSSNLEPHRAPVKLLALLSGPLAFSLVWFVLAPAGMSLSAAGVLAATAWIGIWWVTEAIPIAATSLLPIVLLPIAGGLDLKEVTAAYGHKLVFLYIGGFVLAIAIEKWNLHRRIALAVIDKIGVNGPMIILGFMVATAALSMWISNTATAVMMVPIGMAIVSQMSASRSDDSSDQVDRPSSERVRGDFGKALMLGIAYSASIGGMATLIGTPPNLVLASNVSELYGIDLSFAKWMSFALPISIVLLLICWLYLTRFAFQLAVADEDASSVAAELKRQRSELGKIAFEERLVLIVFGCTAAGWIGRSLVLKPLGVLPMIDDTIIGVAAAVIIFVLPSSKPGRPLLDWHDASRLPWGIVLLFGGGMALAFGFSESGLATYMGSQLTALQGVSLLILILAVIAGVNFLTEITSNLATTAMILPILATTAVAIDVHPLLLLVAATVAASCAFMLPVATPPNAVVFGAGYLRIKDMVRAGLAMNLISIAVLSFFVYVILPAIWNLTPKPFPDSWKPKPTVITDQANPGSTATKADISATIPKITP